MVRRGALAPLAACGLIVCTAGVGGAPVQQRPDTIRSGTTLVPLDVRVLDGHGRPITDLTRDDFTVLEDGVPRPIEQFWTQALTPAPVPDGRAGLSFRTAASATDAPRNQRVVLVVLGRGRLQGPSRGFDALRDFVRERLLPQDHVAVLAYNRAADFTTDHERISSLLNRLERANDTIEAMLNQYFNGLQRAMGSREIPAHVQRTIDEVFTGTEGHRLRSPAAPDVTSLPPPVAIASAFRGIEGGMPDLWPGDSYDLESMQDLANLYRGIDYLRHIDGEKHLIYVTEFGIFLPGLDDGRSVGAAAAHARVAVHVLQVGGLALEPASLGWNQPRSAFYSPTAKFANRFLQMRGNMDMKEIARMTGGQAFIFRRADAALERFDRLTRFHYLLAYTPVDAVRDGQYRRITVWVTRPDARVLHRHGYFATGGGIPRDRREAIVASRIESAGSQAETIADVPIAVRRAGLESRNGQHTAEIDLSIDVTPVPFRREGDRYSATLDVAVFAGDGRERVIADVRHTLELDLSTDEYARVQSDGYSYTIRLSVPTRPRYLKAVLYDYGSDRLGTALATLR